MAFMVRLLSLRGTEESARSAVASLENKLEVNKAKLRYAAVVLLPQNVLYCYIAKSKYDDGNNNNERAAEGIPMSCMNCVLPNWG
jgi:hypothetical protein